MALAVAEQFPGAQECWGAAQSPVDIGSGFLWNKMGCGNKEELNLPPSVCSDQKGVQGAVPTQKSQVVWQWWDRQQWISSARMNCWCSCTKKLLLWLCSAQETWASLVQEDSLSPALTSLQGFWQGLFDSEALTHQNAASFARDWFIKYLLSFTCVTSQSGGQSSPDTLQEGHWHSWRSGFNASGRAFYKWGSWVLQ